MATHRDTHHPPVFTSTERLMALETEGRLPDFHGRQKARSLLAGQRGSRMRGRGLDFDELRRYTRGDDIRHLDWRATQRTGTPFIRSFTEERDRPTLILCDQRMDMLFGSALNLKATTAAEVSALAAWMSFHAGDRVGGIVLTDQQLDTVPPHRSRQSLISLFSRIACHNRNLNVDNRAARKSGQLDKAIRSCLTSPGHDQTVFIISDFAGLTAQSLGLMQQLSVHNDVLAIQIYDPVAVTLPSVGVLTIAEDHAEITLDLEHKPTRKRLAALLNERFLEVDDHLQRSQIPHLKISTGEPSALQVRRALGLTGAPKQ